MNRASLRQNLGYLCLCLTLFAAASPARAEWAAGEIRRLDAANSRMTIKHGEIKSLDMPPMTMVFQVRNPGLFQGLSLQDKIEFKAIEENKKYVITEIRRPAAQ